MPSRGSGARFHLLTILGGSAFSGKLHLFLGFSFDLFNSNHSLLIVFSVMYHFELLGFVLASCVP